jgi:UTP--glucose-1-phosphate uridylyltransferase
MKKVSRIQKAVFPVAGLGTRFLPATKAIAKEMLPIVDKPLMQYAVEEAYAAGIRHMIFVTGRSKRAIEDHFDTAYELERELETNNKTDLLKVVRSIMPEDMVCSYVRQPRALGLGHAVLCAEPLVGNEPFAVLLPDDLIDERDALLGPMLDVYAEHGGIVLGLLDVGPAEISRYGCVVLADGADHGADVVPIVDLVEKPKPEDAPSTLAIIGRYVLPPEIFAALRDTEPGAGGEIQLTDAMKSLCHAGTPVHGVVFRGRRYDTGDRLEYVKAVVQFAARHPDIGADFRAWLREYDA